MTGAEARAREILADWDSHGALSPRLATALAEALRALLAELDDPPLPPGVAERAEREARGR